MKNIFNPKEIWTNYTQTKCRVEVTPDVEPFQYILDNTQARESYYFSTPSRPEK